MTDGQTKEDEIIRLRTENAELQADNAGLKLANSKLRE
jgi:hypothetical protein